MRKIYVANAFSLQMLNLSAEFNLLGTPCTEEEFDAVKKTAVSVVGHPDTARVLGVEFNRVSLHVERGDILYVAQVVGGRLPEGATKLPDGFSFKYVKIHVL